MARIHGIHELADKLLDDLKSQAMITLLTDYDFAKSIAEVDAEIAARSYQERNGRNISEGSQYAEQKLREVLIEWLETTFSA